MWQFGSLELDYYGRPARHEQKTTIAVERAQATVEKPADIERKDEAAENEAEPEITLASLRNVIGP
jgi:hypothetical protein